MSLIEARGLGKRYGEKEALKDIDMKVEKGEFLALIGPTVEGKTTLLRLLDFLEMPTSGRIYFDGMDATESKKLRSDIRRKIAFVLQKPIVFNMSVHDNIAYGLKWRGMRKGEIREKVGNIVERVGLSEYKNRNARTLSGGEMQRVALARAMVIEPEVLLLDEPTANLDPISTSKIEGLISGIIGEYNTAMIMATHDISQGQRLADRIGVLIGGQALQIGNPEEIFSSPQNRAVAEFVGVENIIEGVIASNEEGIVTIDIGGKVIEALSNYASGEGVCACVRPEDITLALSKASSSARNSFIGVIRRLIQLGPLTRVEIDCGFLLVAHVTRRSAEELDLRSDREVYASFKATGVHVIRR